MTALRLEDFVAAFDRLPEGTFTGTAGGARYSISKTAFSKGRACKLVATELGGRDYISLNLYKLTKGPRLYPCEMSVGKVVRFVLELQPDQEAG